MAMRVVQFDETLWGIQSTSYSPALRLEAKLTPGLRWNRDGAPNCWSGWPDAVFACILRLRARGITLQLPEGPPMMPSVSDSPDPLRMVRDYQMLGVRFLMAQAEHGALLADDMGLGKTVTALRAAWALGEDTLIVCPSFVRHVWQREIAKWLKPQDVQAIPLDTTNPAKFIESKKFVMPADGKRHFYIIHYDIVHAWSKLLLELKLGAQKKAPIGTVIFDEGHYLQSDKSRRSNACRDIARRCLYKIALTGTPMTSRPRDLWNLVDTLSEGRFGRPFDYYLAHCNAFKEQVTPDRVVWNTKGASRLEELKERMRFFMLRRTKSEVQIELPPRTRQVVELEVARCYSSSITAALKSDKALREALLLAGDGKIPKAVELAASHVSSGSKVVVFTYRKFTAESISASLAAQGLKTQVITGDYTKHQRVDAVDAQPDVLCCTMDSTAVGIDFSYADVGVFVELDWVPSKLAQAESRLHRFGQKRNVLIQYIIALSTADEVIADVVIEKLANFEKGIGKLDDGLKESLEGNKAQSQVEQLKRLYEKIVKQRDAREERWAQHQGKEKEDGRTEAGNEDTSAHETPKVEGAPRRRKKKQRDFKPFTFSWR